ncbi:alpha/beta hydrolase family protein [Oenococcus oeni]|uniref:alpha/beta hydrolase family protein n=1 Tax=Oenococcus oeni TaxID=1247 RepID=UPI000B09B5E1|nr:alpha/beta fold hydrolase [Oenococcus oeni]
MRLIFNDQTFSFELLRTLSYAPYGGADIGECLLTAYRIAEGDFESWYHEWAITAQRTLALADEALDTDQFVSAREAYLRASNYYRAAEFFLHGNVKDSRLLTTWRLSRDSFQSAAALMDITVEPVNIPYEDISLPGYSYRQDDSKKPRPTLIIHGGYDSTGEELYFNAVAALQRGYNCLTFEGPGQGSMIREKGLPFRNDWETVITPVVDFLLTRPEVDPNRIVLMGISFGGHLAPRAAAFEHRLAACIADDGIFSFQFVKMGNKVIKKSDIHDGYSLEEIGKDSSGFTKQIESIMQHDTGIHWAIDNGLFTFKAADLRDLLKKQNLTL